MAWSAQTSARSSSGAVLARAGSPPAASVDRARRSAQTRSWARIATRGLVTARSAQRPGEMPEDIARRDDAGRAAVLDHRDVAEAADGHLVDRDRERLVVAEDDGIRRHQGPDRSIRGNRPGDLQDRVARREDPDEAAVLRDEVAVEALLVHPADRVIDVHRRVDDLGRCRPQRVEVLAQQAAVEADRRLRHVPPGEVRAAVVADVGPEQVLESAGRAAHPSPSVPRQSTVQVSPLARTAARSPLPVAAIAAEICPSTSWSWVGRGTARRTPTGTGKSGQNIRDSISARYGSGASSSCTRRSASVTPFSPIVTTSGWRPRRRMPLSRSLPKIIGLPCSRTSIRSSRTSRSVKSRQAPSLKMLQFWRTSTNVEPWCIPARWRVFWRCSVWVSTLRATKEASAASATVSGWIGVSTVPAGVDLVFLPNSEVGLAWPFVRP